MYIWPVKYTCGGIQCVFDCGAEGSDVATCDSKENEREVNSMTDMRISYRIRNIAPPFGSTCLLFTQ